MKNELTELQSIISVLMQLLSSESEEHCNQILKGAKLREFQLEKTPLHIRICQEYVFIGEQQSNHEIKYMIGTFDNGNLKITIDGSKNHARPHIHIGHKKNHHAVSIAIDEVIVLIDSGDIAGWKVGRVVEWIIENKEVLNKIWRCIQPWGDTNSADKRKSKLTDL
jgi:hypothetical protein